MRKEIGTLISLLVITTSTPISAEESEYSIAYAPGINFYSISSKEGDSKNLSEFSLLKGEFIKNFDNKSRISMELELLDTTVGASKDNIGQKIKGNVASIQYQKKVNFSRQLKLWFGGGITLQNVEYTDRTFIDSDGFKDTSRPLADDNETKYGLIFSVRKTEFIDKYIDMSLSFNVSNEGINGASLNMNWYPQVLNF